MKYKKTIISIIAASLIAIGVHLSIFGNEGGRHITIIDRTITSSAYLVTISPNMTDCPDLDEFLKVLSAEMNQPTSIFKETTVSLKNCAAIPATVIEGGLEIQRQWIMDTLTSLRPE